MLLILTRLVLAAAGGLAGFYLFNWLLETQGLYGITIPGALVGLAAGLVKPPGLLSPILCGLIALTVSLYAEWNFRMPSQTFPQFLPNAIYLPGVTLAMIGLGTLIGFWVPFRCRRRKEKNKVPFRAH